MTSHILGLDVIPTTDSNIFHIFDTSSYSDSLGKTCMRVEIDIPGFTQTRLINVTPNFNIALNSYNFGITVGGDFLSPLPDGIYDLKYSVSPNDKIFINKSHLRTVQIDNQLFDYRCKVKLSTCEPNYDVKQELNQINTIESYIKAAKCKLENCYSPEEAMDLLSYAKKLLTKQTNC